MPKDRKGWEQVCDKCEPVIWAKIRKQEEVDQRKQTRFHPEGLRLGR